jgi:hypothetical protein
MSSPINMHTARMALNRDPELRQWAEQWLREQERAGQASLSDAEFEKHWRNVKPERMHEGAVAAVVAYEQHTRKQ